MGLQPTPFITMDKRNTTGAPWPVFKNCILLLTLLFLCLTADAGNLIKNPLFEKEDSNGRPVGWTLAGGGWDEISMTRQSFKGSKALMGKSSKDESIASKWSGIGQYLHVGPGEHELEFYARVLGDGYASAHWTFFDPQGRRVSVPRYWTRSLRSANEWTRMHAEIDVPEGASDMRLMFWFILDQGKQEGILLLDGISLVNLEVKDELDSGLPEGAQLVMEEDFSDDKIPVDWEVISGEWQVAENSLRGAERGLILFTRKIGSPNMRIEYSARAQGSPADLSALVAIKEPAPFAGLNGYFFGFGSQYNSKNSILKLSDGSTILAEQGGALEAFDNGIKPGVSHRVVVQRDHNELKLFVDGELVLEGNDRFFGSMEGELAGFYIWEEGYIEDVKIYALPWKGGGTVPERKIDYVMHEDFQGIRESEPPTTFKTSKGAPDLKVVNRPTWIYSAPAGNDFVRDHCLEIKAGMGDFKISLPFEPLQSGIIEFDFLAEELGEIKFSALSSDGLEIINLFIADDGRFMTKDGEGQRTLRDTIRYQRRVLDSDFRFRSNMWYTVRLQFTDGLKQIALLDLYSEIRGDFPLGDIGDYLPLAYQHEPAGGKAKSFVVSASGPVHAYIDNLIIFGPVGSDTVKGKPITQTASALLDLEFPPRKDPFSLKVQSYRHLTRENLRVTPRLRMGTGAPDYRQFRDAGNVYNRALVKLAFLEERLNMLNRAFLYIEDRQLREKLDKLLPSIEKMYASAEHMQERALNAFALAYLSHQDVKKLDKFYEATEDIHNHQQRTHKEIETCIESFKAAFPDSTIVAFPSPFEDGEIGWSVKNNRWEINGKPAVYNYFSQMWGGSLYWDDLKILGFQRYRDAGAAGMLFPFRSGYTPPDGFYTDDEGPNWRWLRNLRDDGRRGLVRLKAGLNFAVTCAPPWWIEKHGNGDVFFTDASGRKPSNPLWRNQYMLDWWNPEVKNLIEAQFEAVGRNADKYREAVSLIHSGWELKNTFPAGVTPGYSGSSVEAFRNKLRRKHDTIDDLNLRWNSAYASFEDIHPPKGIAAPSGLQYEFRKFIHEGFTGWLGSITKAIKKHAPGIPVGSDTQYTLGGRLLAEAIDPVGYFRAVDVKLYHTYQAWDRKLVDRWHSQLGNALDTPWGTMEWIISQGCAHMFETDRMRNNGLREKSMLIMWGGTMPEFYGFGFGNWQYTTGIHEPRLDRMVFNYTAPLYPIYMERARRMGKAALEVPLAKPEVGLLETTASYYNGLSVREGMRPVAVELTDGGWNFEFLYEQLLEDNLQSLDGTEVLFIPSGLCMTDALANKVYDWVKNGGVMFATGGPAGIMNEYGRPSGRMTNVFPENWKEKRGRWQLEGVEPFLSAGGVKAWMTEYGSGRVIVFDALTDQVFNLLPDYADKSFGSNSPDIQFCMREKDGTKYLYALNWSINETVEAEVYVKGSFASIRDEGLEFPMEIPSYEMGGRTYFKTKLTPAGMTVFRIK